VMNRSVSSRTKSSLIRYRYYDFLEMLRRIRTQRTAGVFFNGKRNDSLSPLTCFLLDDYVRLKENLFKCRSIQCYFSHITRVALLTGMVALLICENITKADEVPAFFLKIARIPTLPRVGRSGRYEDFFYPFKTEKYIPRIGRNSQQVADY